jgi:outer membrane receptor protein involved in Fe transport
MLKIFTFFLCSVVSVVSFAQMPGGGGGMGRGPGGGGFGGQRMNIGHFYGKVVDAKTSKGVDAASVQLIISRFDSSVGRPKDSIISGMLTRPNGDFSLENLPVMGNYRLSITAIGYKPVEQRVAFQMRRPAAGGAPEQALTALDKDLGNIKMEADAQVLENVTVSASRPMVQMGIDRKVFNVDKNIASVGGTAVDVMRNVPSVQVDIDGGVTLRNNSPQIFVDGRPTTLTLEQIPADAIQSIEIITNPSAKFDASGGTSGILNIVLKKNRRAGYSGNLRAGVDSRARFNLGGDLNARQGKINLFGNVNYNQRKSISTGNTERLTFGKNYNTLLEQNDKNIMLGSFAFARIGMDYFVDNRNTITIGTNLVRGQFKPELNSDIFIDTLYSTGPRSSYSNRQSNSENEFKNFGSSLSYKHLFSKPGKEITADLNYNSSRNENMNIVSTNMYKDGNTLSSRFNQLLEGKGNNSNFTAQTDFTNPLSEQSKLEMGARVSIRNNNSRNDISQNTPPSTVYVLRPQLSSEFEYTDKVYAAYGTYSNVIKDFGYMLGLRAESSEYEGQMNTTTRSLKDTVSTYGNSFPISLFPSIFLTQKFKNEQELQLNYSRRINRPNFFQLFPFTDYSDSLNLSRGNPGLTPEFTSSFELSYQKLFAGNNSLLVSAYYKHTNNLITRIFVNEVSPVDINDTLIVNTFTNANSSYVTGLEATARTVFTKWWEVTTNVNLFTSKIDITQPGVVPQDKFFSWFAKINNQFRIPSTNLTIQLSGDYQSKTILPPGGSGGGGMGGGGGGRGGGGGGGFFGQSQSSAQGYIRPNYGVDAAIRYEFLKEKNASLSLSMNDVFRTKRSDVHSESPFFIQDAFRRRDPQVLRLNFNYRFGKFDVSLLKRRNNRTGQEGLNELPIQ